MKDRTRQHQASGRSHFGPALAFSRWIFLVAGVAVLGGCAEPWKAPVESRSEARYRGAGQGIEGPVYRVRRGDTLYGIAWRAGVDYRDLARWNRIAAPYTIYVGQKLHVVPQPTRAAGQPAALAGSRPPPPATASPKREPATSGAPAAKTPSSGSRTKPAKGGALQWRWPTEGRLVETFSPSDPARKGIKIGGRKNQPVVAAEGGEIVYSGSGLVGYGELIIIKHNNDYLSAYGYNNKRLVKEGQRVARGDAIAEMGVAGGRPLLHFEIRRRGKPVDPAAVLPRR